MIILYKIANCAGEVARHDYCEATVASSDLKVANKIKHLFEDEKFRIHTSTDIATVELCGALKNIVAMGAGLCDALDYGYSSKAAIGISLKQLTIIITILNLNIASAARSSRNR